MNTTNPYAPPQASVQDVPDSGDQVLADRGAAYVLVDALFIFGDQRQCLHDKIADTIVIKA